MGVSEYEDYEPMDVLTRLRKWSQLTLKIVRKPYSTEEEKAIIHFLKTEDRAFARRKGKKVWKEMEENKICPGRTWQSMKQRWVKFISNRLAEEVQEAEEREMGPPTQPGNWQEENWMVKMDTIAETSREYR